MSELERDPRIVAAAAHWSHRMVTNGVPLADFQDVTNNIHSWDEWCSAWCERGSIHDDLGKKALDEKRFISYASHSATASACYHFGKFLYVNDMPQMKSAHKLAIRSHREALRYLKHPGERVEIPFENHSLIGNLRKPEGIEKPPIVVMCMGLDSTKEEMLTNEAIFLERGLATFSFDGPGQGEAEYTLPIRFDYEVPVGKVIDWLESRGDINSDRVGVWGVSLGGYYAPRAAAFDSRIKACVSLTGPFNFEEAFARVPGLTRQAFIVRSHSNNNEEAEDLAKKMDLSLAASKISCPIYIVGGALDRVIPPDHAKKLADAVSGEVILNMVSDGTHVVNNRPYKYRPESGDWMAKILLN